MENWGKADRLRHVRTLAGFRSASEAARSLGMSVPTYVHHENGTREFGEDAASTYARKFHANKVWLLLGEGSPFDGQEKSATQLSRQTETSTMKLFQNIRTRKRSESDAHTEQLVAKTALIPEISQDYSRTEHPAAYGRFVGLEEKVYHAILNYWGMPVDYLMHELGCHPDRTIAYQHTGDAMKGVFQHGDILLISTDFGDLFEDGNYLISDQDTVPIVRRVERNLFSNPQTVTILTTDNSRPGQIVEFDRLLIVGLVRGRLSRL